MEDFEFDEQDGGLPVLTKKSTAPTEDNDLPILKKKVDGNVSANGMPLPSPSKSDFQSTLQSGQAAAAGTAIKDAKPSAFKQAAEADKERNQSYLGAVWNNVVGSVERLAGGAARLANKFEYSPQNEIMANAMKAATEATGINYQALQEKEIADKFKNFIGKAKTGASSEEHRNKIIEGFDVTNGIGLDDIKALGVMIPAMVTDMAAAVPTAGTSFLVQGYDDALSTIDKMPQAKDMKESTRTAFGIGGGIVAGVLEKLGLDNILKSGTTTRYVTAKVIKETAEELAKKGAKVTAEELEQAIAAKATDMLKNTALKNTIKAGAKSAAIEGVTEATQEGAMDLLKIAANKLEDKEIFDTEELKNTAASRYLNNAAAGGLLGGIAGGAFSRLKNLERHVQDQVSEAKSQEDIQKILSEINDNVKDGTINEDEAGTLTEIVPRETVSEGNVSVLKPEEVRKPDATTIGAPEYTPETKKSGVTVQLSKQEPKTLLEQDAQESQQVVAEPTKSEEPLPSTIKSEGLKDVLVDSKTKEPILVYSGRKGIGENIGDEPQKMAKDERYFGTYFTPKESEAKSYSGNNGEVLSGYIKSDKVFDFTEKMYQPHSDLVEGKISELPEDSKRYWDAYAKDNEAMENGMNNVPHSAIGENLLRELTKDGYEVTVENLNDYLNHGEKNEITILKNFSKNFIPKEKNETAKGEVSKPQESGKPIVEEVSKNQPTAGEGKTFAQKDLDRAEAKKVHAKVREMESPTTADQIALRYLAEGGKIGELAINEVAGTVKRAKLNTGERELKSTEAKSRDYYSKEGETLDELAHSLWEKSGQEVPETEIKDALMDAIGNHNTRLEASKAYLERYSPEYQQEQHYERLAEQYAEEHAKEEENIRKWLAEEGESRHELENQEEHINQLIKQYESESKAENKQSTEGSKGEANQEVSGRTSGEKGKDPPNTPIEPISEAGLEGEYVGITHAEMDKISRELGLPEYETNPETIEKWDNEAKDNLTKNPESANALIAKLEKGTQPTPVEQRMMGFMVAALKKKINDTPTNELIRQLEHLQNLSNKVGGREVAKSLVARKGLFSVENTVENLADALVAKRQALDRDLTEQEKADVAEQVKIYKERAEVAEAKVTEMEEKAAAMAAAKEFEKTKKSTPRVNKSKEDFVKLREDLKTSIRDKWKKAENDGTLTAVPLPYAKQLAAIAPDVAKLVRSYVEEGVTNLQEVIDNVRGIIPELSDKDVHDIIAGEYNKKQKPLSKLQSDLRDLKEEAKLVNKLESLLTKPEPKDEKAKIERNRNITELRNEIKKYRKEEQEANKFYGESEVTNRKIERMEDELNRLKERREKEPSTSQKREKTKKEIELQEQIDAERKTIRQEEQEAGKFYTEETNPDVKKLQSIKKRNERLKAEIEQDIANKNFSKEEKKQTIFDDKELQKKYPKLYQEALDAVKAKEDAKHDFDIALLRDEMSRRSTGDKISDIGKKTIGTIKAIVTGIDNSAVGIQSLVSLLSRPSVAPEALGLNLSHMFSQKRFDRWLTELHNSEMYPLMKESGLSVTEPMSLKESEKEEAFNNRFNGTVKIKGKEYNLIDAPLRPFERAFTTMGNAVRVLAFKNIAGKYLEQGYTFEKNPELFKSLAQRLNTESGRGKENEIVRKASDLATIGIWSPKLMASKFNMLGISDLTAALTGGKIGTKGYYWKLHPKERKQALLDVVKFSSSVIAISYLAAWAMGGEVDNDPLSPTFMTVTMPSGKTINFTGGFSGYIRYIAQIAAGKEFKDGEYQDKNRGESILRFFRSKTPPLTSSAVNAAYGKDFMGKPTTLGGELYNMLPISAREIGETIKKDGSMALFTALPTFYGMNIRDNKDFDGKDDDLETLIKRNAISEEQEKKDWKNYNKGGQPITEQEEIKYNKERDDYIKKRMTNLWNGADAENMVIDKNGKAKKVSWKEMTKEQVKDATNRIKSDATRKTKEKLFGDDKKGKKAQSKLSKLKARLKD